MSSKTMFDRLQENKAEIEHRFGSCLGWQRLDDKQTCRIRFDLDGGTLTDEAHWPELQDRMIDAMVRFEEAIRPNLNLLERDRPAAI